MKNEPVVHCVLAGLTLAAPISRSPVGALVVTVRCVDSIWMFKQESGVCVCVCGPHLVPLELDTNGYRYFTCGYWSDTVSIPHRGYQHP